MTYIENLYIFNVKFSKMGKPLIHGYVKLTN